MFQLSGSYSRHQLVSIYMHTHISVYTCVNRCMYVCMHACMYVCVCTYVCTYVCMYACMHACTVFTVRSTDAGVQELDVFCIVFWFCAVSGNVEALPLPFVAIWQPPDDAWLPGRPFLAKSWEQNNLWGFWGFRATGFLSFRALGCWGFRDLGFWGL